MKKNVLSLLSSVVLFFCSSCDFIEKIEQRRNMNYEPKIEEDQELISIADLVDKKLKTKIIVFAHQSVGMNIVEGLIKIGELDNRFSLNVKLIETPSQIEGAGFYHFAVGENHKPYSKLDHFKSFIDSSKNIDIAFMKFCYVDIKDTTNIISLFEKYTQTLDSLQKRHQDKTFVHVTCPYRSEEDANNANRNEYNKLFRKHFAGTNQITFDLALIESTKKNGDRAAYRLDGRTNYRMNRSYTKDSGHLNNYGSYIVAKQLLIKLAELVKGQ